MRCTAVVAAVFGVYRREKYVMRCTAVIAAVFGVYPISLSSLPADLYTIQRAEHLNSLERWSLAVRSKNFQRVQWTRSGNFQRVQWTLMMGSWALYRSQGSIERHLWKEGQNLSCRRREGARWAEHQASSEDDENPEWHQLCDMGLCLGTDP